MSPSTRLVVVSSTLALLGFFYEAGAEITGNSKAAGLNQCVEPTGVMRRNHMEFLMHQRDLTVHQGIRTKKYSLVECVACHAESDSAGKFVAINAEGQFCQSCHAAVAVSMDCFECHAARPDLSADSRSLVVAMSGLGCVP